MKAYSANDIRNIAILGHGGKGKTTLCEAMLYTAGATDRLGKVADGNTVLDFDAEEKRRKTSVSSAMATFEWNGRKMNIIDAPGFFDFEGGVAEAVRAGGSAVIVTSAGSGVDVGAEKAFKAATNRGIAKFFVVTGVDAEDKSFYSTFDALKAEYGTPLCPILIPLMNGNKVECFVNFIKNKAFKYSDGKATEVPMPEDSLIEEMHSAFLEAVAMGEDELMEKFFAGETFTHDEIVKGLKAGIASGDVYPILACSGLTLQAVEQVMDVLSKLTPAAGDVAGEWGVDENNNEIEVKCDENGSLAAICFKTVADPFVGKMSFIKVISGKITPETQAYISRTGETEKMGKIISVNGAKQTDIPYIGAGDIGVVTKLSGVRTGDTLSNPKKPVTLMGVNFPRPCLSMAVSVRKKGEEEKVAQGLNRLIEEDPTLTFYIDKETREQILSGLGEQHLDVVVTKLKTKFGVEVDLTVPRVAYRETIRKKVEVQGRHKKQSGGHGQFGDVWIRFEPCDSEELIFEEEVFGGSVPKNFFPAVEKGLRESVAKGAIAGYPMVNIKATLYDGSYHPVDSSEMAFKTAASIAFKNAVPLADPAILEPVGTLKAYMPDENLGDIMGDVTKRRGRVIGMGAADEPKMQELVAEVPMAEMGNFSTILRSVTAGKGYFTFEFTRYEEAPKAVADKVIADYKASLQED